jgi:1-acyl-sn-glycerol-3-phosphate acyltransferase
MNDQPYGVPEKHWPAKLTYWWFRAAKRLRIRALRKQQIAGIELQQMEHLQEPLAAGHGVMIAPNHSFHWDSYCLLTAADYLRIPFYTMTAWQVFSQSGWFECESMQRCGCFSVDRENADIQAMKTAMDILQNRKEPLVVFPEGDIYHTNDRLTALRDGAAAIASMAARKSQRPVVIVPVAIKRWYLEDPTSSMTAIIAELEKSLAIQAPPEHSTVDRILKLADELLSTQEAQRLGQARQGSLPERLAFLADAVLGQAEVKYQITTKKKLIPERIKEVRQRIIKQMVEDAQQTTAEKQQDKQRQWNADMQEMFFVTQLYSYPGDYLDGNPSWERQAETVDKLQEDVLGACYPTSHGRKTVQIRFGEPIELPRGKDKSKSTEQITSLLQQRIQEMLDSLNREYAQGVKQSSRVEIRV